MQGCECQTVTTSLKRHYVTLFFFLSVFVYLFAFSCARSLLLCPGFL